MTETLEMTKTDSISDLKTAVRLASREARNLALESDAMPQKIEKAIKQDVRRRAKAAREGNDMAAVDEESDVARLRQRQKDLPLLIWSAQVHYAALEVDLFSRQQKDNEQKAEQERSGLLGLRMDMEEATRKFNAKSNAVRGYVGGASRLSYARSQAEKRLQALEQEYPS